MRNSPAERWGHERSLASKLTWHSDDPKDALGADERGLRGNHMTWVFFHAARVSIYAQHFAAALDVNHILPNVNDQLAVNHSTTHNFALIYHAFTPNKLKLIKYIEKQLQTLL